MRLTILIAIFGVCNHVFAQQKTILYKLDSLFSASTATPFNGSVIISVDGKIVYRKTAGYADFTTKQPVTNESEFVIGSISKQITAVIVLREVEKGRLHLNDPIHKYLPDLTEAWADTVTIHHLLTHTHGITALDKPLAFTPGSRFAYGFISYDLLSQIVERTSGKTYPELCMELFKQCGMKHSFHPRSKQYTHLAKCYTLNAGHQPEEADAFLDVFAAAGGLISNAEDLSRWNDSLHGGTLLDDSTYHNMITPKENAFRDHAILGKIDYGYGVTIPDRSGVPLLAVTGVTGGYFSEDVYFPFTKTSVIVLENIGRDMKDLKKSFYYHEQVLNIIRSVQ